MDMTQSYVRFFCLISAGATLGLMMGSRSIVKNLYAGLVLYWRNMRAGNLVEFDDGCACIENAGSLHLTLRTRDGVCHVVPNQKFLGNLFRRSPYSRKTINICILVSQGGLSSGLSALEKHAIAHRLRCALESFTACTVEDTSTGAITLSVKAWVYDAEDGAAKVKNDVLQEIWDRMHSIGLTIPMPRSSSPTIH